MGNILINACIGSMGNMLNEYLSSGRPIFLEGESNQLLTVISAGTTMTSDVILVNIDLTLKELDVKGSLIYLLAIGSVEGLQKAINDFLVCNWLAS